LIPTSSDTITDEDAKRDEEGDTPTGVTGVVVNSNNGINTEDGALNNGPNNDGQENIPQSFASSWKINVILVFICCWFAMSLTSWGSVASAGTMANPSAGDVGMWMIMCSQWLMNLLYLWTLVAPKIFPNRDF
jgi:hypothetical protein